MAKSWRKNIAGDLDTQLRPSRSWQLAFSTTAALALSTLLLETNEMLTKLGVFLRPQVGTRGPRVLAALHRRTHSTSVAKASDRADLQWFLLRSAALTAYRRALRVSRYAKTKEHRKDIAELARAEFIDAHKLSIDDAKFRLAQANQKIKQLESILYFSC